MGALTYSELLALIKQPALPTLTNVVPSDHSPGPLKQPINIP